MKRIFFILCTLLCAVWLQAQERRADLVNVLVGTAASEVPSATVYGRGTEVLGQTLPAVLEPNGQTLWTPQTRATERKCVAPYYHDDPLFMGIRASHWVVGGCMQDYGSVTVMVAMDSLHTSTAYTHEQEVASPSFYSVFLPDEGVTAQVTASSHSALLRYVFHRSGTACLTFTVNSDTGKGSVGYDALLREVKAENPVHRLYQGRGQRAGFSGWFVAELPDGVDFRQVPISGMDTERPQQLCLSFRVEAGDTVLLKAATSMRSADGARRNMNHELPHWNFEQARRQLAARWEKRLSAVEVESNDTLALRKFYTALYHASFLPRLMSDCDETPYYTDFSMWDTYRALHPLLALLWPRLDGQMMQSLVQFAERRGWLPTFPCWDSYTAGMIGDHCTAALCDAWVKGVRTFDIRRAYRFMRQNAFRTPRLKTDYQDGKGRRALCPYLKYGYIPLEDEVADAYHRNEQTSRTLEYAYDDFCLAQVAKMLGRTKDAKRLMRRARNWQNVFDERIGYVNGRQADGQFLNGTNPFELQTFITEGAPCHYTWYVPHDVEGLMAAMGGRERFLEKLDTLFCEGYYWHGNEPCHQIPYLYALAGRLDKTQAAVERIMREEYRDTPGGLSGNDDAGQMSAWYVFSALGFYPLCPGTPDYVLGLPAFARVVLHLENGRTLTILRDAPDGTPCTAVTLNGKRIDAFSLSHQHIMGGGTLRFSAE